MTAQAASLFIGECYKFYVPDGNAETVRRIVRLLLTYDYIGGVFVDNKYGAIPGALIQPGSREAAANRLAPRGWRADRFTLSGMGG